MAQQKRIWLASTRKQVQSLALLSGLRILHYHELRWRVQTRLGSGVPVAVAAALIRPLAWEPPYAASAALKGKRKRRKEQLRKITLKSNLKAHAEAHRSSRFHSHPQGVHRKQSGGQLGKEHLSIPQQVSDTSKQSLGIAWVRNRGWGLKFTLGCDSKSTVSDLFTQGCLRSGEKERGRERARLKFMILSTEDKSTSAFEEAGIPGETALIKDILSTSTRCPNKHNCSLIRLINPFLGGNGRGQPYFESCSTMERRVYYFPEFILLMKRSRKVFTFNPCPLTSHSDSRRWENIYRYHILQMAAWLQFDGSCEVGQGVWIQISGEY